MQQADPKQAGEVERALDEILSRKVGGETSLMEKLMNWFKDWFSWPDFSVEGSSGWWSALRDGVVILAFVALLYLLVRLAMNKLGERFGTRTQAGQPLIPVHQRVAQLRLAAREARQAGNLRLALQKQFFALVLGLGERGDLEFRDAWTNRELLALGSPSREVQAVLAPLLVELEPKEFGREPVLEHDLNRLEELAANYFGVLAAGVR
jgi:hypothetical protein